MEESLKKTIIEDWQGIVSQFPIGRFLLPRKFASMGFSSRLNTHAISRLLESRSAEQLAAILDQVDDARIKALRTYAAIYLEQISSAFRLTLVVNVTVPFLLLTFANLLVPGGLGQLLKDTYGGDVEGSFIFGGLVLASVIFAACVSIFALAQLNRARDIRNLIDLHAANRGIYYGLEDAGEMPNP
jgi:hypothetical protein